jgi:hypothetical protein
MTTQAERTTIEQGYDAEITQTHATAEQIDALAIGRLEEPVVAHVLICDRCMEELERTGELMAALRSTLPS